MIHRHHSFRTTFPSKIARCECLHRRHRLQKGLVELGRHQPIADRRVMGKSPPGKHEGLSDNGVYPQIIKYRSGSESATISIFISIIFYPIYLSIDRSIYLSFLSIFLQISMQGLYARSLKGVSWTYLLVADSWLPTQPSWLTSKPVK